jgi:predicted SnoaL-like aldol condensation-catalyzing enzyme
MIRLIVLTAALAVVVPVQAQQQLEANKRNVVEFYNQALNEKNFEAASKYLGARYIPHSRSEIKRVLADGDFVIMHVHSVREPGSRGRAIVDLFRLENGKIVEHWDVVQDVPEKAANANGMF